MQYETTLLAKYSDTKFRKYMWYGFMNRQRSVLRAEKNELSFFPATFNKLGLNPTPFPGIARFKYILPPPIKEQLVKLVASEETVGIAKRVNIPNWKAGKTISTSTIQNCCLPEVLQWYQLFANTISGIVGVDVQPTGLDLPTSCCTLIYDQENDFINWHFDVNYFKGRFFTVLLPLSDQETCTKFMYKDHNSHNKEVEILNNVGAVFEGEKVFHMATKLCKDQKRVILSLQFATDPSISIPNKWLMRLKDVAYIG